MDAEEAGIKMMEYFKLLIDDVLGMLIYGSVATGASTERSDIDVCVVAPLVADKVRFSRTILANVKDVRYDVRLFELMPLYIQMDVIEHGTVIYTQDIYELYEYFYGFRKLWEDQKARQRLSKEEALDLFVPAFEKGKVAL